MTKEKAKTKGALINDVAELLYDSLGGTTVEKYKVFYKDRTEKEILMSCEELLGELVGPKKAKEDVGRLYKKYKFKK